MSAVARSLSLLLLLLLGATAGTAQPSVLAPYQNPALPVERRVADLLGRMTAEEKCQQLQMVDFSRLQVFEGQVSQESLERVFKGKSPGMVLIDQGADAANNAIKIRDLQQYLRAQSRLGIPALFLSGGPHGVLARGTTIFPQTLALGATWDVDLVREMAAKIADEASAIGVTQLLGPSFALGRDPRFGGIEQTFGECPTLVSEMGLAFLEGVQGHNPSAGLPPNKVFGTALHFTGWAVPDGGLLGAPVSQSMRALRALHLLPFERAVTQGQAQAIVPVLSEINGIPAHANSWLLNAVLRDDWNFPGCVLSEFRALPLSQSLFHIAATPEEAALAALGNGIDVETGGDTFSSLPELLRRGKISSAQLDTAAGRVLRLKFLAGLFDDRRVVDPEMLALRLHTKDSRKLALRLAGESLTLLKNTDNFLPLNLSRIKTLSVIGPNADRLQLGDNSWTASNKDGVTVLRGLRNLLGNKIRLNYSLGCDLSGSSTTGIAEAVAIAKSSDAVLLVLGDNSSPPHSAPADTAPPATTGAGYDVSNPVPPGVQEELARAVIATGRPTIVLFLHGRPFSSPWLKENATAIVSAFYPGEAQGTAVAQMLFGQTEPGGRLPVSIARSAGHIPTTYDHRLGAQGIFQQPGSADRPGRDYVFDETGPLWAFGFGLSYTRFQYRDLVVETPSVASDGIIRVRFTVTNIGERPGSDVPQIYVRDQSNRFTVSSLRLVRFEKVRLQPGESITVLAAFETESLAEWDRNVRQRIVEPGEFDILVGSSAETILLRGKVQVR